VTPEEQLQAISTVNDSIRDRLIVQRDSIERIETKGTLLLGFAIAASQFLLTRFDDTSTGWTVLALVAYGLAFIAGLVAIAPYRHDYPPDPVPFFVNYGNQPPDVVVRTLAASRAVAYVENASRARTKGIAWWFTVALLAAAVALSGLALR
jgi:hypothetical protein